MSELNSNDDLMSTSSSSEDELSTKSQNNEKKSLEITKNQKWTDRERVLLLCSRGSLARTRHLVNDLKRLMPHVRSEAKYGKSKSMADDLNEMSELANCTKCLYFESRKSRDWISHIDGGPSAKFLVRNLHSMNELNMIGNCLKGSRPILSFDPKFRNYQIIDEKENELQEIGINYNFFLYFYFKGPRFVLQLIRIFDGSFCGEVLYDNPEYLSPNYFRRQLKLQKATEFNLKKEHKEEQEIKEKIIREVKYDDPIGDVFNTKQNDEENEKKKNSQKPNAAKTLKRKILKGRIRKKKSKANKK